MRPFFLLFICNSRISSSGFKILKLSQFTKIALTLGNPGVDKLLIDKELKEKTIFYKVNKPEHSCFKNDQNLPLKADIKPKLWIYRVLKLNLVSLICKYDPWFTEPVPKLENNSIKNSCKENKFSIKKSALHISIPVAKPFKVSLNIFDLEKNRVHINQSMEKLVASIFLNV